MSLKPEYQEKVDALKARLKAIKKPTWLNRKLLDSMGVFLFPKLLIHWVANTFNLGPWDYTHGHTDMAYRVIRIRRLKRVRAINRVHRWTGKKQWRYGSGKVVWKDGNIEFLKDKINE